MFCCFQYLRIVILALWSQLLHKSSKTLKQADCFFFVRKASCRHLPDFPLFGCASFASRFFVHDCSCLISSGVWMVGQLPSLWCNQHFRKKNKFISGQILPATHVPQHSPHLRGSQQGINTFGTVLVFVLFVFLFAFKCSAKMQNRQSKHAKFAPHKKSGNRKTLFSSSFLFCQTMCQSA